MELSYVERFLRIIFLTFYTNPLAKNYKIPKIKQIWIHCIGNASCKLFFQNMNQKIHIFCIVVQNFMLALFMIDLFNPIH